MSIINLYGLTQDIRPLGIYEDDMRFTNDISLRYEEAKKAILRKPTESELEYANRLAYVISQSIAHIDWKKEQDTSRYHQLIPIWENYFIYFMGIFSGIPEYEKYHFADYDRSIKRGIGICGDASMIMSQLLDKQGINNQLLSFPGHVVLSAKIGDNKEYLFDPDFGVSVPFSPDEIQQSPTLINDYYKDQGYSQDLTTLNRIYDNPFERWNGVKHFITKKYYFEKLAYWLKWPAPLFLIFLGFWILKARAFGKDKSKAVDTLL